MEINEKLQELRKQRGLTQEELAAALYVSRTAISKWESGRGYPNIESLKAISKFFGVTIDELLSSNELLTLAEEDTKQKETHFCDLFFGLLDISIVMLVFLPFFGQKMNGIIQSVPLLSLRAIAPYLRFAYYMIVTGIVATGILTLTLQNCGPGFWVRNKRRISLFINLFGVVLFVISLQPYAAILVLVNLIVKVFMLMKRQ